MGARALPARGVSLASGRFGRPQPRVVALVAGWFVSSLASLFIAKHVLSSHPVDEGTFTLSQFAMSVGFGLLATKVLRLRKLDKLTRRQLRAVVPLSVAFLVKELLKYVSIARVSVNLVNTIRSAAPLVTIALEYGLFRTCPPRKAMYAMTPIVLGVVLTSVDEMHVASKVEESFFGFLVGLGAAVLSTTINQGQNVYSKVLFGRERIDPVSLQIYLSGISLALLAPSFTLHSLFTAFQSRTLPTVSLPSPEVALLLSLSGFVNFLSSQLAFSTLSQISPVSYSVANTFKRVCIAIIAIAVVGERLSPVNGTGIVISTIGVFLYERASREYKASKMYRQLSPKRSVPAASSQAGVSETLAIPGLAIPVLALSAVPILDRKLDIGSPGALASPSSADKENAFQSRPVPAWQAVLPRAPATEPGKATLTSPRVTLITAAAAMRSPGRGSILLSMPTTPPTLV